MWRRRALCRSLRGKGFRLLYNGKIGDCRKVAKKDGEIIVAKKSGEKKNLGLEEKEKCQ